MSANFEGMNGNARIAVPSDQPNGGDRHEVSNGRAQSVQVALNAEQLAAVEGWRAANRIDTREEAVQELVRIGLLSEIARIYRMVSGVREDPDDASEDGLSASR
ncbi:MAG: hypothetical protein ACXIVF_19590 [Rhizobiaceae bacterium]